MSLTLEHRLMAGQTSGLPDAHILPYWAFSPALCANTLLLEVDLKSDVQLRTHAFNLLERHLQIS